MPSDKKENDTPALEVVVDRADLVKELSIAQGVVERKSTVPILGSFLFQASANKLLITATDLDLSLRTFCVAKVRSEGACTIPARRLYDYIRLLPNGEITFKVLENDWVQLRSGRSHTKMVGLPRNNFPSIPSFPKESAIHLPAAILRTMIQRTIFAISQEESRYTLNGALLILGQNSMTMVATDGHRLAYIQTKAEIAPPDEIRVLIPKKALAEVHGLLNLNGTETLEFARDESTLFFRIGNRLLTSRQLTGTFPSYDAVMPREYPGSLSVPAVEFSQGLQRVAQFADERSSSVRLKVNKQQLRLSSSSPETGESEETLDATYVGDPAVIAFNARYLLDFTKAAGADKLTFHFKGADAAAEFRPEESTARDYKYRYVVMPMRT